MVKLCDRIGLEDDAQLGPTVRDAKEQIEELKAQRRVISEWTSGYDTARQLILGAYRGRYADAYEKARIKVEEGRAAVIESAEFARLGVKAVDVRIRFMGAGCQLQEVPDVPLANEADLIAASNQFSLPLLQARVSGADKAVAEALAFMDLLLGEKPPEQYATWETSQLIGRAFSPGNEAAVDEAFDKAKADVKALLVQGKTVRII